MPRPVRVVFTRHADRSDKNKSGITQLGGKKAKLQGQERALAGQIVKRFSSFSKRGVSTAKKAQKGHEEIAGKRYKLKTKIDITTPVPKRLEWERIVKENYKGNKRAATIAWLRGKIPGDVVIKPEIVIPNIIRKRVGLGKRIVRLGTKDIILENFTHQELMLGIFEMLTGKRVDKLAKPFDIKYLESMEILLYKNGKATLRIKKATYDVSQRLSLMLNK